MGLAYDTIDLPVRFKTYRVEHALQGEVCNMRRSIGVTISAILVLIGSLLWLAISLLTAIAVAFQPVQAPPSPWIQRSAVAVAGLLTVCSLVGLATSIGLFRLKRWARISLLIFASVLAYMGGGAAVSMLLFPLGTQQELTPQIASTVRIMIVLFLFLPTVAIGGWWLYLFNKTAVKAQFPQPSRVPRRPVSITIIAILLLVGAIGTLLIPVFRWPVSFLGFIFTGWVAMVIYLAQAILAFYLGFGLLRLNELARKLAIGYLVYSILNMILFVVLPGIETRLATSLTLVPSELMKQSATPIGTGQMSFWLLQSAVISGIQLWFLISRKQAFVSSKDTASPVLLN